MFIFTVILLSLMILFQIYLFIGDNYRPDLYGPDTSVVPIIMAFIFSGLLFFLILGRVNGWY